MGRRLSLSIALASYNGERYIGQQLDSIARQTRLPDELIISDDASADSTLAVVLHFARHAPFPVRLLKGREHLGTTRNFESAIRACSGDIIFLCDQDDVWYSNKIEIIEERFITAPSTGAVFTDADIVDQDLNPLAQRLWKAFKFSPKEQAQIRASDALEVLLKHPVVTGATMAFRSTYRDLVLPLPATLHDAWIALLIGATSSLDPLPVPLIAYRQHGGNQFGLPRPGRNRYKTCAQIYGSQIHRYEAVRTRLLEAVERFPAAKRKIHILDEALIFSYARAALPDNRLRRLAVALHELTSKRYHRHAHGFYSFCKDLIR